MGTPEEIAQAIWEYETRTLTTEGSTTPSNQAEEIAEAIWEYATRELSVNKESSVRDFEVFGSSISNSEIGFELAVTPRPTLSAEQVDDIIRLTWTYER
jgi:deoxyhypusine synthase